MARTRKYSKRILVGLESTVAHALDLHCKEIEESYSQVINICLLKCLDGRYWQS